jgi:N-glycosylase/DNA lyase
MEILLSPSQPFDLDVTLCCGQAFRWDKRGEWWYGVVGEKALKIRQTSNGLEFENSNIKFVKGYFGLNDDLQKILSQIHVDEHVGQAINAFKGLRILRQEPWECLISYICATYKNIKAIKHMLLNLSEKFGEKTCFDGCKFYTFPTSKKLAKATVDELSKCGLGYRAKYVSETAKMVYERCLEIGSLRNSSYEDAKRSLLDFPGVGLKVADCVSLFSLGKYEAFPVDVWMKRAMLRCYTNHFSTEFVQRILNRKSFSDSDYEELSLFGRTYFGKYAGYAQEYLYHYERTQS